MAIVNTWSSQLIPENPKKVMIMLCILLYSFEARRLLRRFSLCASPFNPSYQLFDKTTFDINNSHGNFLVLVAMEKVYIYLTFFHYLLPGDLLWVHVHTRNASLWRLVEDPTISLLRGMIQKFWSLPCSFVQRHFWEA